ncbi:MULTISPECIES: helix-turn-helix domain-containing protein [Bradyrhizobium]|uniref:helix-turn-helix domain-containing protein n=1 Tax=Bradyrhizobium TaxID=374 RepID=UPI000231CB68|nr:helix-turn-helix transcriptional regulator [Bradyrhizobium japonicum]MCS3533930.1 hypothetical protein [Bradyrhizobium japonicum]MCS3989976.1 hypothetical protein [Bradyrhizobium japonicum]MCS4015211.1 hypothetical protein [Bradyrhizobium japonicum]MCS4202305.1 hypothetical protein [Bradyrhizobium japonicum]MDH6174559.1 hypothetical protein [Bradyrhizobium japonicum]
MTQTITGTDVLRKTLKARNKSPNAMAVIASEIDGVGVSTLEDFSNGKAKLGVETLQALAKILFDAEFDPTLNVLRSANKAQPITMGNAPPPFDPERHPSYHPAPAGPWTKGGLTGLPHSPPKRRPGWLDRPSAEPPIRQASVLFPPK